MAMDPLELAMLEDDAAMTYTDTFDVYGGDGTDDGMGGGTGGGATHEGGPYPCRYAKAGLTPSERTIAGQIATHDLEMITCRPSVPVERGQYVTITPEGGVAGPKRLVYAVMAKTAEWQLRVLVGEESA